MSSSDWYTASLRPDLSQGDIVRLVPTGLIDDPLTICVQDNAEMRGKARYAPYQDLTDRSVGKRKSLHASFTMGLGMVLWPDCQVDKQKNQKQPEKEWIAAVFPVRSLAEIPADLHPAVLTLDRAQWFPLPRQYPELPSDSFVDLRRGWPVKQSLLRERVVSLSEAARSALGLHLFWFNTELWVRDQIKCPHCAQALSLEDVFDRKAIE